MPPTRWLLTFTILGFKYVLGASVAEEINFEVSNMRELAKNDSQVQFHYTNFRWCTSYFYGRSPPSFHND